MDERVVHAELPDGGVLVHYLGLGEWRVERDRRPPFPVTLTVAVLVALDADSVHTGLPGGEAFDAAYRSALDRAQL